MAHENRVLKETLADLYNDPAGSLNKAAGSKARNNEDDAAYFGNRGKRSSKREKKKRLNRRVLPQMPGTIAVLSSILSTDRANYEISAN